MKKIIKFFFTGISTLLPLIIWLYLIYWLFTSIDNILLPLITRYIGKPIPGIGFIITIGLFIIVGFVATNKQGKKSLLCWENIVYKIPMLGKLYATIKHIISSVFTTDKRLFLGMALVEFPRPGIYSIGFITNDSNPFVDDDLYSIFIPTTPNPTSGFLIMVPKNEVKLLDMNVDRGIEYIMSVGMVKK